MASSLKRRAPPLTVAVALLAAVLCWSTVVTGATTTSCQEMLRMLNSNSKGSGDPAPLMIEIEDGATLDCVGGVSDECLVQSMRL